MKIRFILVAALCVAAAVLSAGGAQAAGGRDVQSFDHGWRFHFGDVAGAEKQDFSDADWRTLDVPHDWMIEGQTGKDPGTMEGPFDSKSPGTVSGGALNGGVGWYRKTFSLPPEGRHVFVQFDGVYMNADVWLNGEKLGTHPYGYTSFEYDLTKLVKTDRPNVLAVRTEVIQPCSRFYSGGGIYRHVWLTTTAPVHVDHWGTTVTSEVKDGTATVNVKTHVVNDDDKPHAVSLTATLLDPKGQSAGATMAAAMTIDPGKAGDFVQTIPVRDAALWSIETPNLYKLQSVLNEDSQAVDNTETPFGLRTIEFTVDKGFFLNGQHVAIQGVCDHHDLGCLGAAVNKRAIERQLEILKSFGCNGIRTSHYPPDPELLDLCDRMGFVVMDEAFDEWKNSKTKNGYGQFFDDWSERDITSMLRRDRNHPSVVLWSVGNEIREQGAKGSEAMTQRLVDICHREDPTRMATSALSNPGAALKSGFSKPLDVFGVNYQPGFYANAGVHGIKPMIGSETSSNVSTRGEYCLQLKNGKVATTQKANFQVTSYDTFHPGWATSVVDALKAVEAAKWIAGEFVWTGFDYIGEPTPFGWPSRSSYFGIVDLCGFPKDRFYLYQSRWSKRPMVHVLPTKWNWDGFEGLEIPVWCYTNADTVELFLNDKSLGERAMKDAKSLRLEWSVPYAPGTLKAVAKKDGLVVATDRVVTAGKPAKVVLTVDRSKIQAGVRDLSFVTVSIVDADGHLCPDADDEVTYTLDGPGIIAGLDDGDATNHEPFQGKQHRVFHGLGLAVLQAGNDAGELHLTANAAGLAPAGTNVEIQR